MCSLHLTHPSAHTPGAVDTHTHQEQWAIRGAVGVRCLAQGSHLSRGQFLPEPGFEPTTSSYKSNALSIRPRLPFLKLAFCSEVHILNINPLNSKPHKWWLRRAFVRKYWRARPHTSSITSNKARVSHSASQIQIVLSLYLHTRNYKYANVSS